MPLNAEHFSIEALCEKKRKKTGISNGPSWCASGLWWWQDAIALFFTYFISSFPFYLHLCLLKYNHIISCFCICPPAPSQCPSLEFLPCFPPTLTFIAWDNPCHSLFLHPFAVISCLLFYSRCRNRFPPLPC